MKRLRKIKAILIAMIKMKTTRKVTAIFIAFLVLMSMFAGCSKDDSDNDIERKTTVSSGQVDESDKTEKETQSSIYTKSGDIIYFGQYEQDNDLSNGKEKIAWRVLAVENGKAFLLADKILDCIKYNVGYGSFTWETCNLRRWLNDDFFNAVFNSAEQEKIITTDVENEDNPEYGTGGGNNTNDKVFLLSYSEVTNPVYGFNSDIDNEDSARQAQGTEFSKNNGLWVFGENYDYDGENSSYVGNSNWWSRSLGSDPYCADLVCFEGTVYTDSSTDRRNDVGVRPVLWINLSENEDTTVKMTTSNSITEEEKTQFSNSTKSGDIIYFGKYEQDNDLSNGKEKIAWRVLTVENGKAFLLADKILDAKPYNVESTYVTWETCTLRTWLNVDFYNTAFSSTERSKIKTSTVINANNPWNYTTGGNNTSDKLFLLSYSEVTNPAYGFDLNFRNHDTARRAQGTNFAKSNGLWVNTYSSYLGNSIWWLRSPGYTPAYAGLVTRDGDVSNFRNNVNDTTIGVRPALWINL